MERLTGKAYATEDFQETIASILMSGLKMNKRTHALQLMLHIQDRDIDVSSLHPTAIIDSAYSHVSIHGSG